MDRSSPQPIDQPVELGRLLANTIASVVQAQEQLDAYTERRTRAYQDAEHGDLALPPMWYTFSNVSIDMELSATVARVETAESVSEPHIFSRTLNPTSVGLFGYQASTGLRVRVDVDPNRLSRIRMSLVPLPRETTAGAWSSPAFTPFRDIEEIQGIG